MGNIVDIRKACAASISIGSADRKEELVKVCVQEELRKGCVDSYSSAASPDRREELVEQCMVRAGDFDAMQKVCSDEYVAASSPDRKAELVGNCIAGKIETSCHDRYASAGSPDRRGELVDSCVDDEISSFQVGQLLSGGGVTVFAKENESKKPAAVPSSEQASIPSGPFKWLPHWKQDMY